ncbi:MAG: porin [Gammaproteobacteria bacterium]|nr:porin [Gammaproteobacteria bacterium]
MKKTKTICAIGLSIATLFGGQVANADSHSLFSAERTTLFTESINNAQFMQDLGLSVGGWIDMGATYNFETPRDNNNTPVTFNDRHLEFQLNQFYLYFERAVNAGGNSWDIGGRVDFLFGTDGRFTLNSDLDDDILDDSFSRFYRISFPQIYAEVYAPVLNGVTAKIGHFYTIIGNEVVTSPDNFFYSHAYTMQYGEPFEHNGFLLTTPINDNLTLMAGGVLGWDNFSQDLDVWNFLGGLSWSNDTSGLTVTTSVGPTGDSNGNDDNNRWIYSVVASHDFTDSLHLLIQHDHANEELTGSAGTVEWYGINSYLTYDITDQLSAGVRGEWFRDDDGARVTGDAGNFFGVTGGFNYAITGWLKIRPEVRYDWFDGQGDPFDGSSSDDQVTVAADLIVTF